MIEWDEEIDGPRPETPKVNRFYPRPRGVRAIFRDGLRWARLVPNRADRRSAAKGATQRFAHEGKRKFRQDARNVNH